MLGGPSAGLPLDPRQGGRMTMPIPRAFTNSRLSTPDRKVWMIDEWPCAVGQQITVVFEQADQQWRHGVFLGVDGTLEVAGNQSHNVVLWADTAPPVTQLTVIGTTDGFLRLYNVWDSGRGLGLFESQKATSGMVREVLTDICVRYHCNSIGVDPDFSHLRFTVALA